MSNIVKRVFRDLVRPFQVATSGLNIPLVAQIGASPISQPMFAINDRLWVCWHMQHDYVLGSDVFFHMHWLADGTNANEVKWQFAYYHAQGHNQASFALGGGGTVVSASQASPAQYRHMITETEAVSIAGLEPDSVVLCEVKRVANGATDNTDNIFGFQADLHYEADVIGTPNRAPPFYG